MYPKVKELTKKIIDIRYKDQLLEKQFSTELLEYSLNKKDIYGIAFAYTFLGDYFITQNDMENALEYLVMAKDLLGQEEYWEQLYVYIYALLGLVYEVIFEEQNSISHFLESMKVARKIGDKKTECIVLNNLAIIFQQHNSYNIALDYLQKAYEIQKEVTHLEARPEILSTLGDLYLQLNDLDNAKKLYKESEEATTSQEMHDIYEFRNQCCYYGAKGNQEKARYWAKKIFEKEIMKEDMFGAFDSYKMLCEAMLKVKDQEYAYRFLQLLEKSSVGILEHQLILEEKKIEYSVLFEDEDKQTKGFLRFYKNTQKLKSLVNQNISESMKEKIYLHDMLHQKEAMEREQESLVKEANIDETTGIYNRRYLELLIEEFSQKSNQYLAVIMIDVDYFKEYNDYYGHVEGDNVLYEVASCLKTNQREGIHYFRFGGDEFICLCENISSEDIEDYICHIQQDLYNKNIKHYHSPCSDRVTLSFGYANKKVHQDLNIYTLLRLADEALYDSKVKGRNTFKQK